MGVVNEEAETYKNKGNEAFKAENFEEAISLYSKAISLSDKDSRDAATYLKNRAAAYLKIKDYDKAIKDCDDALAIVPEDPKALFRRAQALETLERFEEAYRDAKTIFTVDPTNKAVQPVLARLHAIVQERARQSAQTGNKVEQMFKLAFKLEEDQDKREKAMANLLVLAKENNGADIMLKNGVVHKIQQLLKVEKNTDIYCNAVRIISQLCKRNVNRTKEILKVVGIPWILEILDSDIEERVNTAQYCLQVILNTFSGMDTSQKDSKPDPKLCEQYKSELDTLLTCLTYSITNRVISGKARDAIMELIMRNCHYSAINWAERFVEIKGLQRLLEVCSELEEYKYESAMNITPSSSTVAAACLAKIYENMYYDEAKQIFNNHVDEFIKDKLLTPDLESKVRVTVAITSLLRGPLDVGNYVISKEGIMEMILVMAQTEDPLQQRVACECLIAAASKKDKARAIIDKGVDILKKLYQCKDDAVRVRALVGLCKLGSFGGDDASIRPFAEGSTKKLAEACRKFLINPSKDKDLRKWAAEGLSYLTLDADVKEKLVEDKPALQSLIELAKTGDQSCLYGVVTTLVNLCNAYEKQEMLPEMLELAKFAKHHIPEQHELDDPDFVNKRLTVLAKAGVTSGLVALSKTESHNSRELIARVFNAICSIQELRGIVVQQGGAKVLIPMALEGTTNGKKQAAQALARIGITINPEVAFPGQRNLEVVRPLIALLHPECTALENFEALMALCNLAGMNETTRNRILKEGGLLKIEQYLYEDHLMLQRAATQCICNLVQSEEVIKIFEGNNDRTKFLYLLCQEEDMDTVMAASGALCVLTSASKVCCKKLLDVEPWVETLRCLLANPNKEIQYRGTYILYNIVKDDKDMAARVFETDVMEILMALTKLDDPEQKKAKDLAQKCLNAAEELGVIRKPDQSTVVDPFKETDKHSDEEEVA
ncbi:protein unc-45 homolog B [Pectinophora gossypiella]|uniref:Protein unc-45 homolog B n=1 Tax=Pectinophora gossypiella TaxID=13191 RepID=A0A1E1WD76_PECGO|nr:protein unc-45 homolog B [Pectinophora gossypiella]